MSTEEKEKIDIVVNEEPDGSAVIDLPEDMIASSEEDSNNDVPDDGGADHPDDTEAIRAARRQKRKYKKEIAKATSHEKEAQLNLLRKQNEELMSRLAVVEKRTHHADIARIDNALKETDMKLEYAKLKMSEAMQQRDGQAFNEAQDMWDKAKTTLRDLKLLKEAQLRPQQTNNIPDPRLQRNAASWMERNNWYDPNGSDRDSKIAKVVDEELVKEGWDPTHPDYWEELDNRLSRTIPHRYNDDMDVKPSARRPRSVVTSTGRETVNGSTNRGTFVLKPEQVRAMKDAGMWDDPHKRANMIKRYAQSARNNSY